MKSNNFIIILASTFVVIGCKGREGAGVLNESGEVSPEVKSHSDELRTLLAAKPSLETSKRIREIVTHQEIDPNIVVTVEKDDATLYQPLVVFLMQQGRRDYYELVLLILKRYPMLDSNARESFTLKKNGEVRPGLSLVGSIFSKTSVVQKNKFGKWEKDELLLEMMREFAKRKDVKIDFKEDPVLLGAMIADQTSIFLSMNPDLKQMVINKPITASDIFQTPNIPPKTAGAAMIEEIDDLINNIRIKPSYKGDPDVQRLQLLQEEAKKSKRLIQEYLSNKG